MTHGTRSYPRSEQRGVALIVALLVVAVVAVMALLFTQRQQLWLRQLENRNSFTTANTAIFTAINMSRLTLRDDARNNQADHAREPWTIPIPPIAVENGHVAGHILDLNGRLNLTNLLPTSGEDAQPSDAAIQRTSRALDMSSADLAKLVRSLQTVRKAEPRSCPDLAELILRSALPAETRAVLNKHAIVLPEPTAINVNFADAETLQATIDGLSAGDASALIARRAESPFLKLDDFRNALPQSVRQQASEERVAVQSRYFMIEIDAWFNDVHMGYETMLRRDGTEMPIVLWSRRSSFTDS